MNQQLYVCLSVCLSFYMSFWFYLSICLSVYLCIISIFISISICFSIFMSLVSICIYMVCDGTCHPTNLDLTNGYLDMMCGQQYLDLDCKRFPVVGCMGKRWCHISWTSRTTSHETKCELQDDKVFIMPMFCKEAKHMIHQCSNCIYIYR